MNQDKLNFLKNDVPRLLHDLDERTPAQFGKMSVRQMIEHMTYSVRIASGRLAVPVHNTGEIRDKSYAFMMSEKPFRPNTPNANLPDLPEPPRNATTAEALAELEDELDAFHRAFEAEGEKRVSNPFFGELNYAEQVHLLDKHFRHHLRQFGVEI
jgi:hypothetical protein